MARPARLSVAAGLAMAATLAGAPARAAAADLSPQAGQVVAWIARSGDNGGLPFLVVDKQAARVMAFDRHGSPLGQAPALLGLGRGDHSVPGIGQRRLATITPQERTTPAGRFQAAIGRNLGGEDVLWIDYDAAISLHRVIHGAPGDHRLQRLATPTPLDNRISYGCINVPVAFYEAVVRPAFLGAGGTVYVLPESEALPKVFPVGGSL